jgi:undecaprenyl-diphosphatase
MSLWEAFVLGVVQGLTEFLPISSTAHLAIVPALAGWGDPGPAFTAVIQLGTLVAVLFYFRADIVRIARATLQGLFSGQPLSTLDSRMGWMIILGTVPIVVLGLTLKKHIESTFRSLYVISGSLIGLAIVLAIAEYWLRRRQAAGIEPKQLENVTFVDAAIIGLAQAVALVPGSSRSGVTITGGLFCGLSRETAARFSFLLSLPSIFAAGVFELYHERAELFASQSNAAALVVATVVSGIVGYASIAFLLGYLKSHSTWLFIVYRLLLGGALLVLLSKGVLMP